MNRSAGQCAAVVTVAAGWLDEPPTGQSAGQREEVELHLLVCPTCLAHVGKLTELRAALRELPGAAPPTHLLSTGDGVE